MPDYMDSVLERMVDDLHSACRQFVENGCDEEDADEVRAQCGRIMMRIRDMRGAEEDD